MYAFTQDREKLIGTIDDQGRFSPNEFYENKPRVACPPGRLTRRSSPTTLLKTPSTWKSTSPVRRFLNRLDFLPLALSDAEGNKVTGRFSIDGAQSDNAGAAKSRVISLILHNGGKPITLAKATVPNVFRRADIELGSFDNHTGTYLPEAAYRAGATGSKDTEPSVTVKLAGEFTSSVQTDSKSLIVNAPSPADPPHGLASPNRHRRQLRRLAKRRRRG